MGEGGGSKIGQKVSRIIWMAPKTWSSGTQFEDLNLNQMFKLLISGSEVTFCIESLIGLYTIFYFPTFLLPNTRGWNIWRLKNVSCFKYLQFDYVFDGAKNITFLKEYTRGEFSILTAMFFVGIYINFEAVKSLLSLDDFFDPNLISESHKISITFFLLFIKTPCSVWFDSIQLCFTGWILLDVQHMWR